MTVNVFQSFSSDCHFVIPGRLTDIFFKIDTLGASSLLEEFQSDSGRENTTALSTASDQQMETPCSSSSSDLHLSGLCTVKTRV